MRISFWQLQSVFQSLETYINTLPSDTEHKDLKRKLKQKENQLLNATTELATLRDDLKNRNDVKEDQGSLIAELQEKVSIFPQNI